MVWDENMQNCDQSIPLGWKEQGTLHIKWGKIIGLSSIRTLRQNDGRFRAK